MKLVLIQAFDEKIEVQKMYPPLGLAYIASYLEKYGGYKDVFIETDMNAALDKRPDIVGISSVTPNFNKAVKIAGEIKTASDIPIIIGGAHITALPHTLPECFDFGIVAEGEQTMLELLNALENNGRSNSFEHIDGLVYREANKLIHTKKREMITPLDNIPFPKREILKNQWSFSFEDNVSMITSRGCPYKCRFCSSSANWRPFRFHSAEYVVDEIKHLIDVYNPKFINFYDDLFIANKERLAKIVDLIKAEKINEKVQFNCSVRADLLDERTCKLFKEMNLTAIGFGAESGSDKILSYLKKDTVTVAQNQETIDLANKYDIRIAASFIIGSPFETKIDILKTYDFINKNKLKMSQVDVYPMTPYPGTEIWDFARKKNFVSETMDWSLLNQNFEQFNIDTYVFLNQDNMTKHEFYEYFLQLQNLHQDIKELNFVSQLNAAITNKDIQITQLNTVIATKDIQITQLNTVIANKDIQITDLKLNLQERNTQIIHLTYSLENIQQSITWRTLMAFHRFVEQIMPEGTRRRKFYNNGLMVLRSLPTKLRGFLLKQKDFFQPQIKIDNEINNILEFYKKNEKSAKVAQHDKSVDIIVCIHNALDDVKKCLESVLRYTAPPYSLILVDDGSDTPTKSYLEDFAISYGVHLIRNDAARGYTFASNQGMRFSTADYVVLLNSDTIVTPEWIDRMVECAESDARTGIVGPLSNTASWQSVPDIETNGDWAQNTLPNDMTVDTMGRMIAKYSARLYPDIPFLNGFCLMIKRSLINEIGYFDEETFGKGYGEEDDYSIRTRKSGWNLRVADDVYIYHAQSRSYSNEKRKELCERAGKALIKKHGEDIISDGVLKCRYDSVLEGIRARTKEMFKRQELIKEAKKRWEGKRILTILPVIDPGGGAYVVMQEGRAMLGMGVDARIFNLNEHKDRFEMSYPDIELPVIFSKPKDISNIAERFDAVISTLNTTVVWQGFINKKDGGPVRGYYIQDFEPYFYQQGSADYKKSMESYTRFPDLVRVTKTRWNRDMVKEIAGADCHVIGPSVDIDLFRPRPIYSDGNERRPVFIGAMIRPSTPRREPVLTMNVLKKIWKDHKDKVKILTFGCSRKELFSLNLSFDFINHIEVLNRNDFARLFNEIDIFVDFSSYQAMGLTALEAMSCGAAVIVPQTGGAKEFVKHEINGIVIDTSSEKDCLKALNRLIGDDELRIKCGQQALKDVCKFFPEKAAYNTLMALFSKEYGQIHKE